MNKILTTLSTILISTSASAVQVSELSWLEGHWSQSLEHGGSFEENISAPNGGIILGTAKLVDQTGNLQFWEYYNIQPVNDQLVLSAKPFGAEEGQFTSTSISSTQIVFENPQHDFPRVISYSLSTSGLLKIVVSGIENGQPSKFEFELSKK